MKKNCVWLTCALILSLSAAVPAWPNSFTIVYTDASIGGVSTTNSPICTECPTPESATTLLSNSGGSGNAFASASFGAVDATASTATSGGFGGNASGHAYFQDSFSVLSGSSTTGTFTIAFVTTGTAVSASNASGSADAEVFLKMLVGNGSFLGALSSTYIVTDSTTYGLTTSGLPTTVFNIDASNGDTIVFNADLSASTNADPGGVASAVDPVSVFITAPAGFTFNTASGATYSPTPSTVPEPSSLLLLSSGLVCLGAWKRKMLKRI